MAKLHELLAVAGNLENQAATTRTNVAATFEGKKHLFEEHLKTFTPLGEDAKPKIEAQKDIQTSVRTEIEWLLPILAKAMDVNYQIDEANTQARADVVTEADEVLLKAIPATYLLQLSKRLEELREFVLKIPTLDPAKGFRLDEHRKGIYQARERTAQKTQKQQRPLVLLEPTKEHPGKAELISVDVPIGEILEQEWSSMTTPAIKSDILANIDVLIRAVKKARARANEKEVEVQGLKLGQKLLDFAFAPLLQDQRGNPQG